MTTVLYRVDDRLIHGQIIASWVPYTRATRIVVADNQIPGNLLQSKILRMAAPPPIRVEILSVRQAVTFMEQQRSGPGLLTIMLFFSIEAVVQAVTEGLFLTDLNLGNIHSATGRLQIADSISLNRDEIACLRDLQKQDVKITIQPVPTAPALDVFNLLQSRGW